VPLDKQSSEERQLKSLARPLTRSLVLDLIERTLVLAFFAYFAYRMLSPLWTLVLLDLAHPEFLTLDPAMHLQAALLVASEALGVALILARRRSDNISSSPLDWALSLVAVNAPFLATGAAPSTIFPSQICAALMLAGLAIQIAAKATLWRSFGIVPANRGAKTSGLYRIVRHPMYAGYTITHIGFLLGFPSLQNTLLYFTTFAIQVARVFREERILNRDPIYREYAARVRYRFFPRVF
jgi:protein-S-isoprenylcysteine O-methyltransferase Ste14